MLEQRADRRPRACRTGPCARRPRGRRAGARRARRCARSGPSTARLRPHALGKCHELVESKRAVAAHARIRRLPRFVRVRERIDDRVLELLAQVERHVREPALMTRRPRRCDRGRRAARALGVGRSRILPEPERHPDRVRPGTERATALSTPPLIATATRPGTRCRRNTGPSADASASTASGSPPTAAASTSVKPSERTIEARRIGSDDRLVVDVEPDGRPCIATRRVSEDLVVIGPG